jgi:hypothetical protein
MRVLHFQRFLCSRLLRILDKAEAVAEASFLEPSAKQFRNIATVCRESRKFPGLEAMFLVWTFALSRPHHVHNLLPLLRIIPPALQKRLILSFARRRAGLELRRDFCHLRHLKPLH